MSDLFRDGYVSVSYTHLFGIMGYVTAQHKQDLWPALIGPTRAWQAVSVEFHDLILMGKLPGAKVYT